MARPSLPWHAQAAPAARPARAAFAIFVRAAFGLLAVSGLFGAAMCEVAFAAPASDDGSGTATATLIAAAVAATAALASLVVGTVTARTSEGRAAHRDLLIENLTGLGEALTEVVSTSHVQHRALAEGKAQRAAAYREIGLDRGRQLDGLRRKSALSPRGLGRRTPHDKSACQRGSGTDRVGPTVPN